MTFDSQTDWRYARLDDLRRIVSSGLPLKLSVAEEAELARWRHPERREEWILARVLARQLVAAHALLESAGAPAIEICSRDAQGRGARPVVMIGGEAAAGSLSLSHTQTAAMAAFCTTPGVTIGADLVRKGPLGRGFMETWFDEQERGLVRGGDSLEACRLWAAKEAVYKAVNQNDPFAPRQICLRSGERGEFLCTYRGADLGDCCRISTWECDDHIAALVVVCGVSAPQENPLGRRRVPIGNQTASSELFTSLGTSA